MKLRGDGFFAIITAPFFYGMIRLKKFVVHAGQAGEIPVQIPSKDLTLEPRLPAIPQGTESLGKIFERNVPVATSEYLKEHAFSQSLNLVADRP